MARRTQSDGAIYSRGIRPIGFDRHDGEIELLDEATRDGGTRAVEFRTAMTCFAAKNDAAVTEPVKQFAERRIVEVRQLLSRCCDDTRQGATPGIEPCSRTFLFVPLLFTDQGDEPDAP